MCAMSRKYRIRIKYVMKSVGVELIVGKKKKKSRNYLDMLWWGTI